MTAFEKSFRINESSSSLLPPLALVPSTHWPCQWPHRTSSWRRSVVPAVAKIYRRHKAVKTVTAASSADTAVLFKPYIRPGRRRRLHHIVRRSKTYKSNHETCDFNARTRRRKVSRGPGATSSAKLFANTLWSLLERAWLWGRVWVNGRACRMSTRMRYISETGERTTTAALLS